MFDALKRFVKGKKFQESGFARLCKEDGIALRELTVSEMQGVNFSNFGFRLDRAGFFPKGYNFKPSKVDIVPLEEKSNKVNYVNLQFDQMSGNGMLKMNIKNFNVSTAKNDSLVYQYDKNMSKVWMDMCYALLWCQQAVKGQPDEKQGFDSKEGMETY